MGLKNGYSWQAWALKMATAGRHGPKKWLQLAGMGLKNVYSWQALARKKWLQLAGMGLKNGYSWKVLALKMVTAGRHGP